MIEPTKPEVVLVPTYNGTTYPADVESGAKPEYTAPENPITIAYDNGLRLVLGAVEAGDMTKPDIQVERQPGRWVIFIHPEGGGDPVGYLYIMDDGRSFFQKEREFGTPALVVLGPDDKVPE
jgi:hypothetical protein